MVRKYSLKNDGNKRLSDNFTVFEFSSTSSNPYNPSKIWSDEILISDELIKALDILFKKIQAKEARISSGYRTSAHDKAVGGNGSGQHVAGKAVDITFIDHNRKVIDTRVISCVAQDLGLFNGIARISANYIHLDVGNRAVPYLGDETKSYNTVTNNFYKYYNLTPNDIAKVTGVMPTTPSKKNDATVTYQVYTTKWLPEVKNGETVTDYAGIEKQQIKAYKVNSSLGNILYRAHVKEVNSWTPWLNSKDNTFAGNIGGLMVVDAIQMKFEKDNGYDIYYRVSPYTSSSYYPYVKNDSDYAGKFGNAIDKVQVYIKKR